MSFRRISITIPESLAEWIDSQAEANGRSQLIASFIQSAQRQTESLRKTLGEMPLRMIDAVIDDVVYHIVPTFDLYETPDEELEQLEDGTQKARAFAHNFGVERFMVIATVSRETVAAKQQQE